MLETGVVAVACGVAETVAVAFVGLAESVGEAVAVVESVGMIVGVPDAIGEPSVEVGAGVSVSGLAVGSLGKVGCEDGVPENGVAGVSV